jgi:hypothetical protein
MKKLALLFLVFFNLVILGQSDDAQSYSSSYVGTNNGTGWASGFAFKSWSSNDLGGQFLANSGSGGRQIDGTQSFALYGNTSGTGKAVSREFSAFITGITRLTFKIRFDLNPASGTAGFDLCETATSSQTNWNDGQRLFLGNVSGIFKYNAGSDVIVTKTSGTQNYTCSGGTIYTVTVDFNPGTSGTLAGKFALQITDGTTESDIMTANLGGTSGVSIKSIGFGTGVVAADQNLIFDLIQFTDNPPSPLPVELTSFSASVKNKTVNLVWHTATEVNNYGFEIEKRQASIANSQWNKVGFVNGNGNSNSAKAYSFTDNTVSTGLYLYRLKQIDNDGKYAYSNEVEADLGKPTTFALNQNYPNPFNPSTSIQYSVVSNLHVSLKVFNVLGKEVAVLVNEKQEPGTYNVDFSAANLSGGAYFYRLQAGEFVQTKKMIVLK